MTPRIDRVRRRSLAAAAALVLGTLVPAAGAQDANAIEAQRAAREWLAIADGLDATRSWEAAGARFRDAMPAERWAAAVKQIRVPLGAVERRTVVTTRFEKAPKGFPPGDYVLVQFRSSFAQRSVVQETVTLERDGTGRWRVSGYAIA